MESRYNRPPLNVDFDPEDSERYPEEEPTEPRQTPRRGSGLRKRRVRPAEEETFEAEYESFDAPREQHQSETTEAAAPKRKHKGASSRVKRSSSSTSFKAMITDRRLRIVLGVGFVLIAAYILVASISFLSAGDNDQSAVTNLGVEQIVARGVAIDNAAGPAGASLAQSIFAEGLGVGALVLIIYLALIGVALMGIRKISFWSLTFKSLLVAIALSVVGGFISLYFLPTTAFGGVHGHAINQYMVDNIQWIGAALVSVFLLVCVGAVYAADVIAMWRSYRMHRRAKRVQEEDQKLQAQEDRETVRQAMEEAEASDTEALQATSEETEEALTDDEGKRIELDDLRDAPQPTSEDAPQQLLPMHGESSKEVEGTILAPVDDASFQVHTTEIQAATNDATEQPLYDPTAELSHYQRPTLDLLKEDPPHTNSVDLKEQEENKERIIKTLADYGIPISRIEAIVGPTVTLFKVTPSEGIRIAKIKNLEDDIAMSLAANGIRIIAPIPGESAVGIEVANKDPQTVSIRSILGSKAYQESRAKLPLAMGVTIDNRVYIEDLTKMPHLLVAGATGMGKSVGLNTIIASLLYKKHPAELKFVLVDPKTVEFSLYSVLERHYLAKLPDEDDAVVTDMDRVVRTLSSLCVEMDQRYKLLRDANVRSITEYNERFVQHRLNPEKGHRYLPYIVMIVDEFADLMMTAGKQVELPIARIAQKARAVGMHLIVATQRPSTNVITGIIKANFPGRMAFRVSQMVDSKTILDRSGANQLIGKGDMLFSQNGSMERVQCAFIDTPEVQAICDHIADQVGYDHAYYLPEPQTDDGIEGGSAPVFGSTDRDPMLSECARALLTQNGPASVSYLQRRFSIGYNRAGKIMDQLEALGIVSPNNGAKGREMLVDSAQLDRILG